jgi:hypothetical protein
MSDEITPIEDKADYLEKVTELLQVVKYEKYNNNGYNASIDGLLTDTVKPNVIFDILYQATSNIDLKDFISNRQHQHFRDINIIRLTNILLEIINDKKDIDNRVEEFRELVTSCTDFQSSYDTHNDAYTVPTMYIEELKSKLILKDNDYIMSTHLDKLITSIGYINICLFIDTIRFRID